MTMIERTPDTTPIAAETLALLTIDDYLRLAEQIRLERHRDPLRALEDRLLEMRLAVSG